MEPAAFSVGVDLGGTNLRVAAYTRERGLLETILLRTRLADGREAVAADLCAAARRLLDRYQLQFPLVGIAIGSPGPLDLPEGRLRHPPNLPGWDGFELRATVERALGLPVVVENDANVAALAECHLGVGKTLGANSLCMLTLGTGVGGGIILRGKTWDGMNGMAGEVGHLNIWTDGIACGCGGQGCLEPYASATAVRRMAGELIARGNAPGLAALQKGQPDFSAREVADLAREGDPIASDIIRRGTRALGAALAGLAHALDPELIILGGQISEAGDMLLEPVRAEVAWRSRCLLRRDVPVVRSKLVDPSGVIGAAALALEARGPKAIA